MSFLRSLDLYKAVILLSLVLLPLGGWAIWQLDQEIAASQKAIQEAKRPGGLLEQIGTLQKKVEIVVQNKLSTSDTIHMPRRYFEGQILQAGGASLKTDDFGLTDPKEEPATLSGSRQQRASDFVVDVTWPRNDFAVKLDFVYAVLFNCESGAGAGSAAGQSIWKLRELQLQNATDERLLSGYKTPPPELADKWTIRSMKFARREPRKGT
ncbi:MAG: hypothetical protein KF830_03495 [Planctomycetes bacterium]|nr:hypothetical protein [Planctomycetota bacterium]